MRTIEVAKKRIEDLKNLRDFIADFHPSVREFAKLFYGRDTIKTLNLSDLNLTSKDLKKLIPLTQKKFLILKDSIYLIIS